MALKKLKDWMKKLDVKSSIDLLQKAPLLGTAKIVRQVLETWGCWVQLALYEMYRNYQLNRDKQSNNNDNNTKIIISDALRTRQELRQIPFAKTING